MSAKSESRWKQRGQRENNERNSLLRQIEAAGLPRSPRGATAQPTTPAHHRRSYVRKWMRANVDDYETATQLAEGANAALQLPEHWLDKPSHWIWDEAAEIFYSEE